MKSVKTLCLTIALGTVSIGLQGVDTSFSHELQEQVAQLRANVRSQVAKEYNPLFSIPENRARIQKEIGSLLVQSGQPNTQKMRQRLMRKFNNALIDIETDKRVEDMLKKRYPRHNT